MSSNSRNKITRDVVPENFSLALCIVDFVPVIFFGLCCIVVGSVIRSPLFILGAAVCLVSGAIKVVWKILVVVKKKNVWPLFIQMRIAMPVGFLIMIVSFIVGFGSVDFPSIFHAAILFPQIVFFIIGLTGMALMCSFVVLLDSSDLRANWIEQITNSLSQISFFIGLLFLL